MTSIRLASVAALLFADAALAAGAATTATAATGPATTAPAANGPAATTPKPTAAAPTVAQVKTPTAQELKTARCNAEADKKKLAGDARKSFMTECLMAH
jgi:hypothetical protein